MEVEEIEDTDNLYRLIDDQFIDEDGNIKFEAFYLRVLHGGKKEKEISILLARFYKDSKEVCQYKHFTKYKSLLHFQASIPRNNKLGVCHSPSDNLPGHSHICGFWNDNKIQDIIDNSEHIEN